MENLEIWKTVQENPVYQVSNLGRVRTIDHPVWCVKNNSYSIRKGIMCTLSNNNSKGYYRVCIQINGKQKQFSVHRLVAKAFIPNHQNLPQVNHIDGDKSNNTVSNLEWCDDSYNELHAWKTGLKSKEKISLNSSFRKLTPEQISFIKSEYSKVDISIRGNKKKFCVEMQQKFNLKSSNTIYWIIKEGTNQTSKSIS